MEGDHWLGWEKLDGGASDPRWESPHPLQGREEVAVGLKAGQGGSASLTAPLFTTNCDIRCAAEWGA